MLVFFPKVNSSRTKHLHNHSVDCHEIFTKTFKLSRWWICMNWGKPFALHWLQWHTLVFSGWNVITLVNTSLKQHDSYPIQFGILTFADFGQQKPLMQWWTHAGLYFEPAGLWWRCFNSFNPTCGFSSRHRFICFFQRRLKAALSHTVFLCFSPLPHSSTSCFTLDSHCPLYALLHFQISHLSLSKLL